MESKKILSAILNVALIIAIALAVYKYYQSKDNGIYNYCVEWNYGMHREDLIYKCYDYKNNRQLCDWKVDEGNKLIVFDYLNESDYVVYDCTKLLKSIDIELEFPKIEEINI